MQNIQMQQLGWLYPFLACEACVLFQAPAHTQKHRQAPLQLNTHTHTCWGLCQSFLGNVTNVLALMQQVWGCGGVNAKWCKGEQGGRKEEQVWEYRMPWNWPHDLGERRRRRRRERTCLAYDTKPQESDRNDEVISTEGGRVRKSNWKIWWNGVRKLTQLFCLSSLSRPGARTQKHVEVLVTPFILPTVGEIWS